MRVHRVYQHKPGTALAIIGVLLATGLLLQFLPGAATAVSYQGQPAVTVTPNSSGSSAEYVFGKFRTANRENVTGCTLTFPAGTDISSAVAVDPPGSVVATGTTLTITFTNPVVPDKTTFFVTIAGVINPPVGTYNAGNVTMYWRNTQTGVTGSTALATGDYTIADPYISMTITTPAAGQTVDFGNIDPGVATPIQVVTVVVDSSAPYDIIRTPGGDAGLLGLFITGTAVGPQAQGLQTFTDQYSLNPPWTTDPSVPLTAIVTYTVVQ